MRIVTVIFQLAGSLALLMYGMKMLGEGIQKSAGNSLHRFLTVMTSNRFAAVFTGCFITMIIQSSGATTVMVVSFVNAGLITLQQSVGVIFGANIGTTVTAWIVALFGFQFNIAAAAIPVFGVGYLIKYVRKIKKESAGEALMGFGLLFLGLDFLSALSPGADNAAVLNVFQNNGTVSILLGMLGGLLITAIIHSSSAATAVILTLCRNGVLHWEFAAAMVLGCNIGSTIDAVLASMGTKANARRAALVHVLFNVAGSILAFIFFRPLLALVDLITPGTVMQTLPSHVAMLHTLFNVLSTLLFLPFTSQIALLTEKLIKTEPNEIPGEYRLDFISSGIKESVEPHIIRAEKEISDMIMLAIAMFARIREGFSDRTERFISQQMEFIEEREEYADQMQEQLSLYLYKCTELPVTERQRNNLAAMLHIVDEIENITDDCCSIAIHLKRSIEKNMQFDKADMDALQPYVDLVEQLLNFVNAHINRPLSPEEMAQAAKTENKIDSFRKELKKVARKRLEEGADVKAELLYIDLVRNIEKIGDRAYSISEALTRTK
ncbi:Na/Pi cotransporter family protein [Treponema maltophilum]|uniref:Na/Pi cotransporter family protein n=1 Tax=Treponema maltophilum TaxID=51160 RepID=UPI003D91E366